MVGEFMRAGILSRASYDISSTNSLQKGPKIMKRLVLEVNDICHSLTFAWPWWWQAACRSRIFSEYLSSGYSSYPEGAGAFLRQRVVASRALPYNNSWGETFHSSRRLLGTIQHYWDVQIYVRFLLANNRRFKRNKECVVAWVLDILEALEVTKQIALIFSWVQWYFHREKIFLVQQIREWDSKVLSSPTCTY